MPSIILHATTIDHEGSLLSRPSLVSNVTEPFVQILESQSAVLSNQEVLAHIETTRAQSRSSTPKHPNVETVLKEVATTTFFITHYEINSIMARPLC